MMGMKESCMLNEAETLEERDDNTAEINKEHF